MDPLRRFDARLERETGALVLGLDEVGRGCLAGPVVAAAVVLPPAEVFAGLDDSKLLTAAQRGVQAAIVRARALAVGWAFVGPRAIEATDIRRASLLAMTRAAARARRVLARRAPADARRIVLVIDGTDVLPDCALDQRAVVGGDGKSRAVAAASIVAKVVRDGFMTRLDRDHPAYGFAQHKGYGTAEHRAALERYGPCAWHRFSFRPVAQLSLLLDLPS
jgi:ribonuclease HII